MNILLHVLIYLYCFFPSEPFESKLQTSWQSINVRMQLLSIRTKCPSFYRDECRWQFRKKKNPYLAKIKSYPPLSTILLEIYWSINSQSLRTTHWLYNTCFSGVGIQWEAAASPVFHFPTSNAAPARGGGGLGYAAKKLRGFGARLSS